LSGRRASDDCNPWLRPQDARVVAALARGGRPRYRAHMVGPAPGPLRQRLREAAQQILARTPLRPRIALLLSTGHASIATTLKATPAVPRADVPAGLHLPAPLVLGSLEGVPVALGDAPMLPFESNHADVTHPVHLLRALGCELLVLTAGAASLSRQL